MESVNEPSKPASTEPVVDEIQRPQFARVNTYIPEDLSIKLRNVGARIRKSVTEGYATNKWEGEPLAPNVPHTRTQLGLGRPSIFQSTSGEGMRRVYTTPHPFTQPSRGLQPFADFGEPPAKPVPGGSMRVRATSLGVQRATPTAPPSENKSSTKQVPDDFDVPSDSDSEGAKSPGDADAFGELFEFGEEEKSSSVGSSMFASASRPPGAPIASEGNTRTFQQTQSLPAGSLSFAVRPTHTTPLEPLGEDEPWRKHDFGK